MRRVLVSHTREHDLVLLGDHVIPDEIRSLAIYLGVHVGSSLVGIIVIFE